MEVLVVTCVLLLLAVVVGVFVALRRNREEREDAAEADDAIVNGEMLDIKNESIVEDAVVADETLYL